MTQPTLYLFKHHYFIYPTQSITRHSSKLVPTLLDTVLHYSTQHYTTRHNTTLLDTTLHYSTQHYTTQHSTDLHDNNNLLCNTPTHKWCFGLANAFLTVLMRWDLYIRKEAQVLPSVEKRLMILCTYPRPWICISRIFTDAPSKW